MLGAFIVLHRAQARMDGWLILQEGKVVKVGGLTPTVVCDLRESRGNREEAGARGRIISPQLASPSPPLNSPILDQSASGVYCFGLGAEGRKRILKQGREEKDQDERQEQAIKDIGKG